MELLDKTRGPFLGNADNNRKFAVEYMRSHGFDVKEETTSAYSDKYLYYLRGELVGWSYATVIYLQPVMPSLIKMGILAERRKTEIPFDLPGIEVHKRLTETVKELKKSNESYDDLIKRARVNAVRKYFNNKRISHEYSQYEMTV